MTSEETIVGRRRVLIVEDNDRVSEGFNRVLRRYERLVETRVVAEAGGAISQITAWRPEALIVDAILPYGECGQVLREETDPEQFETGLRLLRFLRTSQPRELREAWVAFTTARSNSGFLNEVVRELGERGRLYLKPFSEMELESDLCDALSIPCLLPKGLLDLMTERRDAL